MPSYSVCDTLKEGLLEAAKTSDLEQMADRLKSYSEACGILIKVLDAYPLANHCDVRLAVEKAEKALDNELTLARNRLREQRQAEEKDSHIPAYMC
jgi:hypothetical protein